MAGGRSDDIVLGVDVGGVLLLVVEGATAAACFYFSIHFFFISFLEFQKLFTYFKHFLFPPFYLYCIFPLHSILLFTRFTQTFLAFNLCPNLS